MDKKILIIEDNESYSSVLVQKFTLEKFQIFTAKDGQEGIAKAQESNPDIILVDLLLPKMNGIQVIQEIRKNDWGKSIPFLVLTNLNPDDEIMQNINLNKPADYLIKPEATLGDILEKVKSLI